MSTAGLTALFVILKLTDQIHWSWGWVLSPVWMSAILLCLAAMMETDA